VREPGRTADPSAAPDFLSKTVASVDFMRLSLRRAAYVAAGRAREVGNPGTLGMTKWRVATLIKGGQIGWKERNKRSLYCAALRSR
jgi:hypothetical protein